MAQTKVDLELVLEVESAMSPSREVVLLIQPPLGGQHEASGLDEGEIEVTHDPTFFETPPFVSTGPALVPFDELGKVSLDIGDDMLPRSSTLASTTYVAASTVLGGVTLEIPFIFPKFLHEETTGTDLSGGKVSIPSSPFNVSLACGDFSLPMFPKKSPFANPPLGLSNQMGDSTFFAPSSPLRPRLSSPPISPTGEMGGFAPFIRRTSDASELPGRSSSRPADSSPPVDSFRGEVF